MLLENVDSLIGEKLSLLGLGTRLSYLEKGLSMNMQSIESEDGEYVVTYECEPLRKRAVATLKLYKGGEKVQDFERDEGGSEFPEHNSAGDSDYHPEHGDHIQDGIFIVKGITVHDIKPTNPNKHV